jgi:transposase
MRLRVTTVLLVGGTLLAASGARGEQPPRMPPGCAQIVAVLDQGGGLSPDEIAKKTSTDVETVRSCTDAWRSTMKDPKAPRGAGAAPQPMPPGCAQIVGVLDQGGGLSPDEIAKKTSTDVETVRSCTDAWRRTMKSGATP